MSSIKLIIFFCLFVLFSSKTVFCKYENKLNAHVDSSHLELMADLFKLWGQYKYLHPDLKEGKVNWDNVLLSALKDSTFFLKHFDTKKIETYLVGRTKNKVSLKETNKKNSSKNYYYSKSTFKSPFVNENKYNEKNYPDEALRLLALCRYWNAVYYFYSYTDSLTNWNTVLYKYIPLIMKASNGLEYHLGICSLVSELKDSHCRTRSKIIDSFFGNYIMPPFKVKYVNGVTLISKILNDSLVGIINLGDTILEINNKKTEAERSYLKKYFNGSNNISTNYDINMFLLAKGNTNKIILKIGTNKKRKIVSLKRNVQQQDYYPPLKQQSYKLIDNIQYIDLATITKNNFKIVEETLFDTKGFIIDLRGRPEHDGIENLVTPLLVKEKKASYVVKWKNHKNINEFKEVRYSIKPRKKNRFYDKPIVLIIDYTTISYGETCVMEFIATENVTLLGTCTRGSDGGLASISLPGGITTYFTIEIVLFPNNTLFTKNGICPDITVNYTAEDLRKGKDIQLEKAINYIISCYKK